MRRGPFEIELRGASRAVFGGELDRSCTAMTNAAVVRRTYRTKSLLEDRRCTGRHISPPAKRLIAATAFRPPAPLTYETNRGLIWQSDTSGRCMYAVTHIRY